MAQEQRTATTQHLPAATSVGEVRLTVADLKRALVFYRDILGYEVSRLDDRSVVLTAGQGEIDFILTERPGATPKPRRTSGLFHAAILLPERRDLARVVHRLANSGWEIGGASDHGVSEALYLDDPDGNGLEIYVDRPRESWPRNGEQVAMVTERLNFDRLFAELGGEEPSWDHIPAGTRIGHVHLQVGDIERSEAFYVDVLGFDIMQDTYPGALFIAAGGYHHHIGMNSWAGHDVPQPPEDSAGLTRFTIAVPDGPGWSELITRLEDAGVPYDPEGDNAVVVRDPDGIEVQLSRR